MLDRIHPAAEHAKLAATEVIALDEDPAARSKRHLVRSLHRVHPDDEAARRELGVCDRNENRRLVRRPKAQPAGLDGGDIGGSRADDALDSLPLDRIDLDSRSLNVRRSIESRGQPAAPFGAWSSRSRIIPAADRPIA
jgi:hypothetical protein